MTIMPDLPDDENFRDMLSAYAAPAADDGFTQALAAEKAARDTKLARLRFGFLAGGCFTGGMFASTQFSGFLNLVSAISLPSAPIWSLAAVVVFGFILWATLDRGNASLL